MAIQHGYGASSTRGLFFAYDMGDTVNSYLGEPTTNLVLEPDGNANIITTDVPFATDVVGYAQYSSGYFVNPRNTTPTAASGKTFTYSVWMRSRSATPSTYLMYVYTGTGPDGGWWYFGDGSLTNTWQRYTYTRSDLTGTISQVTVYRYNQQGTIEIAAPQIEEKTRATQFVKGSRTSTNCLRDLTGLATSIDLTRVSYDSNAQMVFDGTDDFGSVNVADNTLQCLELIFYNFNVIPGNDSVIGGPTTYQCILGINNNYPMGINLGAWTGSMQNEAIHLWSYDYSATYTREAVPIGYHHLIFNWEGDRYQIYLDGQQKTSYAIDSYGHARLINLDHLTLGNSNTSSSPNYVFNGRIPVVKAYSQSLTSLEILQNYKKYQTRFGLS